MRTLTKTAVLVAACIGAAASAQSRQAPAGPAFTVVEASIADLRSAMDQGRVTSREIVLEYLARIGTYDSRLHAAIAVNPRALHEAEERDRERAAGNARGPLHGIPIALKDNIHTIDMPTTGGAQAFDGFVPPYEATVTANLRAAGAIILAKTGMTELANWVAGAPTPMPTNYNSIQGFAFNPYDPRRDPRPTSDGGPVMATGGSSSGIGTAASFWAGNVGTETSGSILSPANQNMLAAVKPTVGRVSRYGIIPITADQDTAGPMAKFVADAAAMLGAMEGAAADPNDPATRACAPPPGRDYTRFLRADALRGARIGIPRAFFYEAVNVPGDDARRGGISAVQGAVAAEAIALLRREGAVIVDPANLPSVLSPLAADNFVRWPTCSGANQGRGADRDCSIGFKYGMKRDFNAWLRTLGPSAPVKSLAELREWNLAHRGAGTLRYGQSNLDISDEMDVERDRARYEADRAKDIRLAATTGLDAALTRDRLDALLFPGSSGASIAARSGYPTVMVPFGRVPNELPGLPQGFDPKPIPFGMSFTGTACSEPRLIEIAYAFERASRRRVPPISAPEP